jgi:hypothetical protein
MKVNLVINSLSEFVFEDNGGAVDDVMDNVND